ncbi:MAG: hypothetical protein KGY67_00345 [Candidatus Thermoplasmatota archaeon]|nr:hypothetical protein [Candidatus Thermoplasmatota archaeon]
MQYIKICAKDEYQAIAYLQVFLRDIKYKINKIKHIEHKSSKDEWEFTIETGEEKNLWGNGCFIKSIDGIRY